MYLTNFNPHFREGSDSSFFSSSSNHFYFNPHFREGSDFQTVLPISQQLTISIHTSAREVTFRTGYHFRYSSDFNPHFREGSDKNGQGVWLVRNDFNPHFREGSDFKTNFNVVITTISIHTSAREVTISSNV